MYHSRINHPLAGMGAVPQGMGAWYDSITEAFEDTTGEMKSWYTDLVGEDVAAATDKIAEAAYQEELAKQKEALTNTIIKEIQTVTGGGSTPAPSAGGGIADTIQQINQNEYVAKVPGGVYTLMGVGAVAIILLMRR